MSKSYNDCLSTRIRCGNSTPSEDALADAAPDLLAALQMAESSLDTYQTVGAFTPGQPSGRLLYIIRAALARVAP